MIAGGFGSEISSSLTRLASESCGATEQVLAMLDGGIDHRGRYSSIVAGIDHQTRRRGGVVGDVGAMRGQDRQQPKWKTGGLEMESQCMNE
ncbi:hypothetical protein QJS04_geneDACA002430 [Acorus gramineus]|uniref:Uncharacterized protein n=1 Tax=Acorus gramineus TaxID=55184 RepID=A0AAV9A9C2_ACOGR|nr:hypothetical protein QJS04_geneDACA002430 [Acorus gramineus]